MAKVSVSTQRTYDDKVMVRVKTCFTDKIAVIFNNRHDAAIFLQSLRKRVR